MKKIIVLVLMFALLVSGCGSTVTPEENPSEASGTEETVVSEGISELHEEMLINFGATKSHDGSLVMARRYSLFENREGYADCSALSADVYYAWMMSKTDNSDKIRVAFEGYDSTVYAFDADFFESRVFEFFGVSSEVLRESELYFADQNCYYSEGIPASVMVDIEYVSAEETDGTVVIRFNLSDSHGITGHNLTVKLLEDGGYNYVSYLPA